MKTTLSNLEDGLSLPLLGTMLLSPEGKCLEHSIRIKKKKFNDPPFTNYWKSHWLAYSHSRASTELNLKLQGPCEKKILTLTNKVYWLKLRKVKLKTVLSDISWVL